MIDRVVGSFVARGRISRDEAADVRATVILRVLQQFERESAAGIRDVDDYVGRMAINAVNDVLRGRRLAPVALEEDAVPFGDVPQPHEVFAARELLVLLWDEIARLPPMQRRALLLHARDDGGGSAIHLLVFTGVATLDEIAALLELPRATLEELWDRLPLSDLAIAEIIQATRPQVISLRRAARERLERARRRLVLPHHGGGPRSTR